MLEACTPKYFPSSGRKAFLKLAKAILASSCCSKDGDLAAPAVHNVPLGEKRKEGQGTENREDNCIFLFQYLSQHLWILLASLAA